jgi:acetoin utilization deacetylase AcuC-like enzyme
MNAHIHHRLVDEPGCHLDDRYLLHNPGKQHPESSQRLEARLEAIRQMLEGSGANSHFQQLQPREANIDEQAKG